MKFMAFDGIFIYSLVSELKKTIIGGRVEKVNQPEKDEIILSVKSGRAVYKLSVSASAVYPKIYITGIAKPNPQTPPMFCMVLRKYLVGARILDIRQLDTDRVIFVDFQSMDELGYDSVYTLAVEIMGKHSNITLVRQRDNTVMDCIKHISFDMNSLRSLLPGTKYVFPPESKKLNPFGFSYEELHDYASENQITFNTGFFSSVFTGISKPFSKEIAYRLEQEGVDLSVDNLHEIYDFATGLFAGLREGKFTFALYESNEGVKEFYCERFQSLSALKETLFSSGSELVEKFYFEKDRADRLKNRSSDLQKLLHVNLDRCAKKLNLFKETLVECKKKDEYKILGELLTANIYRIKKGDSQIEVVNYYSEAADTITIKLDKDKTPSENIQSFYKKYNKMKKSEEASKTQIENAEKEYEYLQSVLTNVINAESYEEIEDIKKELIETGYIRFKKESGKKPKPSKPMHFISSDGIDIYVGKNNIQNDYLTLKFAEKHDTWLHTKNIPGSHVIISNFGPPPEKTLLEAALLAAYYSKAKDSTKVPVDYTEVRNVHKPNGARPGMVIYRTNKTIYVDPEKPELSQK
jgi:predicted ribosome quality control (RQC) complex YloA/Tae2 family protein